MKVTGTLELPELVSKSTAEKLQSGLVVVSVR